MPASFGRATIVAIGLCDLFVGLSVVGRFTEFARATRSGEPRWVAIAETPLLLEAVTAVGVVLLLAFLRTARLRWLTAALGPLGFLVHLSGQTSGVYFEPMFQSAGLLLGWLFGVLTARAATPWTGISPSLTDEEEFGVSGATAALAAMYVCAGLSKLFAAGLEWGADADSIRVIALSHLSQRAWPITTWLVHAIVGSPAMAQLAAAGTLVIEVGAVALLFAGWPRTVAALCLLGFHLSLYLMTGILFYEGAAGALLLGFDWSARLRAIEVSLRARAASVDAVRRVGTLGLGAVVGLLLLASCAVLVGWLGATPGAAILRVLVLQVALVFPWRAAWHAARRGIFLPRFEPPPARLTTTSPWALGGAAAAVLIVVGMLWLAPIEAARNPVESGDWPEQRWP